MYQAACFGHFVGAVLFVPLLEHAPRGSGGMHGQAIDHAFLQFRVHGNRAPINYGLGYCRLDNFFWGTAAMTLDLFGNRFAKFVHYHKVAHYLGLSHLHHIARKR